MDLLGKPIAASNAICIPTAVYALPGSTGYAWQTLREFGDMGWQAFGVLELTALPSVLEEHWLPAVEAADILIVGGGNTGYLSYWMHASGFAEKLPALLRTKVYLGVSAGSMVVTHSLNVNREALQKTGIYLTR